MKNLFLAVIAMFISLSSFAQNKDAFIDTRGAAVYTKEVDRYQAEITLSPNAYYSYDGEKPTLEELKKTFFEQMKKSGFEESRFKVVKKVEYYRADYNEDGIVYSFDTGSKDEFEKLIGLKRVNGMNITSKTASYKPLANRKGLIAAAIEDARKSAEIVAATLGKTLGEVVAVSDYNRDTSGDQETYYLEQNENHYYVSVRFAYN